MNVQATQNLEGVLFLVFVGLAVYGINRYTKKHANDPISRRLAEWSIAFFSCAFALILAALVYLGWAIYQDVAAFSEAEAVAVFALLLAFVIVGFYLSRGRGMIEMLRRRKEWR